MGCHGRDRHDSGHEFWHAWQSFISTQKAYSRPAVADTSGLNRFSLRSFRYSSFHRRRVASGFGWTAKFVARLQARMSPRSK